MRKQTRGGVYYVYGVPGKETEMITAIKKHGDTVMNRMKSLYSNKIEYEVRIADEEVEALGYAISDLDGCWMQEDRKTNFLEPIKGYIKDYPSPAACTVLESSPVILYDATLYSDAANCTFATKISTVSGCTDFFRVCGGSNSKILEFEVVDLASIYFMRMHAGTPDTLKVKGTVA